MIPLTPCKILVFPFLKLSLYLTGDIVPQVSLYDLGPSQTTEYVLWNCQICHRVFLWMAEKLTFLGGYKELAGYSCNIYGWKHGRERERGLQRCQQLSCLLKPVCIHIKAQLDSSIIKPHSLPASSASASSKCANRISSGMCQENESPPFCSL